MIDSLFAALLLAGGRSRRMGCDKALLDWRGQPLWRAQLAKLRELKPARLMVSCREEQQLGTDGDVEWLFDPQGDELGPMGAIVRAMTIVRMPLLVLAVDMPWITVDFLEEIRRSADGSETGFFIRTAYGPEPMAAVYAPCMLGMMESAIEKGRLSLQESVLAFASSGHARIRQGKAEESRFFQNMNTPAEWTQEKGRSV